MKKHIPFGISLPFKIIDQIDNIRGDISRSKFIQRILEISLSNKLTIKEKDERIQAFIKYCKEMTKSSKSIIEDLE